MKKKSLLLLLGVVLTCGMIFGTNTNKQSIGMLDVGAYCIKHPIETIKMLGEIATKPRSEAGFQNPAKL